MSDTHILPLPCATAVYVRILAVFYLHVYFLLDRTSMVYCYHLKGKKRKEEAMRGGERKREIKESVSYYRATL